MSILQAFRTVLFYLLLSSSCLVWCVLSVFVAPLLPFRARYRFVIQSWCSFATWLAKWVVGIRYEISGLEHIPATPCVILAKHQSTWETFFLCGYFDPLIQVVKRELLFVPFFGWSMAMLRPIAIDRSNPKAALKQLAKQGNEALAKGAWVLVFPEGTRMPPGQLGKFSRGGAALAVNAGRPVLPVAHNAAHFWPKLGWRKTPGTVQLCFGPLMFAEGTGPRAIAELNERAFRWVEQTQARIDPPAHAEPAPEPVEPR